MKKETGNDEENKQELQETGAEIVPARPVASPVPNEASFPIDDMRNRIADRLASVVSMLRDGTVGKVGIELDNEGNQKYVIDDLEGKHRYTTEIRSVPGVVEKTETFSTRLPREERLKAVEKLHQQNLSQSEIAAKLMVSQQTVSLDLQKLKGKDSKQE